MSTEDTERSSRRSGKCPCGGTAVRDADGSSICAPRFQARGQTKSEQPDDLREDCNVDGLPGFVFGSEENVE